MISVAEECALLRGALPKALADEIPLFALKELKAAVRIHGHPAFIGMPWHKDLRKNGGPTMGAREAAALLHCEWARKDASGRWIVCEPTNGFLHWSLATGEDVTAIEAALTAHPGLLAIHEARTGATGLPAEIASPQAP